MTFSFTLKGTFNAEEQTDLANKLIDAGCDYPEVSSDNGIITLEFSRMPVNKTCNKSFKTK